jgi:hypothetical protein
LNTNVPGQAAVSIPILVAGSSPVGIKEHVFIDVGVFPNPVSDYLTIEYLFSENLKLRIINVQGSEIKVFDEKFSGTSIRLNVTDLVPGIYFLDLNGEKKIRFMKL